MMKSRYISTWNKAKEAKRKVFECARTWVQCSFWNWEGELTRYTGPHLLEQMTDRPA